MTYDSSSWLFKKLSYPLFCWRWVHTTFWSIYSLETAVNKVFLTCLTSSSLIFALTENKNLYCSHPVWLSTHLLHLISILILLNEFKNIGKVLLIFFFAIMFKNNYAYALTNEYWYETQKTTWLNPLWSHVIFCWILTMCTPLFSSFVQSLLYYL